jgi:immunity protein 8 of polymorphic toxin system
MRATVRRFHSPDLQDLAVDKPADPEKFGMLMQMLVGPADGPREESFDVLVCIPSRSPPWLKRGRLSRDITWW